VEPITKKARMSRTTKTNPVKHCSVCFKAGMPLEIYSSHYVRETRDVGSRVTCPIVKHNVCGKCGKTGHFKGSCKVSQQKKSTPIKVVKVVPVKTVNKFDFLSDSEDEADEADDELDEVDEAEAEYSRDFPALEVSEPIKLCKKKRIYQDEGMIAAWQQEFSSVLNLPEKQRNNGHCYWDKDHDVIVKKKYKIIGTSDGFLLQYMPSWASEDEYEEED